MTIREQYQECYRLERLIQQAIATGDGDSQEELTQELFSYCFDVRGAAYDTWVGKLNARGRDGQTDIDKLAAWARQFRLSVHAINSGAGG